MTTLGALYQAIRGRLHDAGLPTPELDARLLISHFTGCAAGDVVLKPDTPMAPNAMLDAAVARRLKAEPVSRIIGEREFYGLTFRVTADVLDPRPDTETLVDEARRYMKPGARVLDICTGTGCIVAALLTLHPDATGMAVDVSAAALDVARDNLARLGVADRVRLAHGNYADGIETAFDVITCNPPYIESGVIATLEDGVRLHDPHLALDGGDDGLAAYRAIFPQIRRLLAPGGAALFEIGAGQGADVTRLAALSGLEVIGVARDLGGRERVVILR